MLHIGDVKKPITEVRHTLSSAVNTLRILVGSGAASSAPESDDHMVTIYDVARLAKVSPATVSRVLNHSKTVNPQMARQVQDALEALEYRPNNVARSLRRKAAPIWAVIISDIQNPHFTSLIRGIQAVARPNGMSVVLCNSDEDLEAEAQYLEVALAEQMSGVIISPASDRHTKVENLLQHGVPVVTIDRKLHASPVSAVVVDNRVGAQAATQHLLEAGYQRIACITGPLTTSTGRERLAGYRRALQLATRRPEKALIRISNFKENGGYAATMDLLTNVDPPDALMVTNSLMTLGALGALAAMDVNVPRDVGIVGFDDSRWAELISPSLSTVAQPTYEMGSRAAELLLPGPAPSGRVTLTLRTSLVLRDSSRRNTSPGRGPA